MAVKCTKCGENHEDWVPKARLEEKNELVKEIKAELKALTESAKEIEGLKAQAAELTKLKAELAERDAVASAGFTGDAKAVRRAKALYNVEVEGMEEGKAPSFADWLADEKGGKAEPGLTAYYKAPAPPNGTDKPAPTAPTPPAGGAKPPPKVDKDTRSPAAPTPKTSAEEVRRFLASPAFTNLSTDQKKAKLAELEAQVQAGEQSAA